MTTKAIGFAGTFYTLWYISEETKQVEPHRISTVKQYTYVKNISMDRETALEKYPDAVFCEELRGKSASFERTSYSWDTIETFRFGKYSNERIEDCGDTPYIEWYWNNIDGEHRDYVSEVLKSRGYEVRTNKELDSQWLMSPKALENERIAEAELAAKTEELSEGKPLEVFVECNPSDDGYIRDEDVLYHFQEVRENEYRGFPYYLPVLNGKAKRVKGKTIRINKYTWKMVDTGIIVEILGFDVLK